MKTNQKGFAVPHIILMLVIVSMIGGIGYYVYSQNSTSNSVKQENASTQMTALEDLSGVKSADEIREIDAKAAENKEIIGVELENEDGKLVYKVKHKDGSVTYYDAKTGEAIAKPSDDDDEVETDDDAIPSDFNAAISADQAKQIASARRPGKTISKIEMESEEGKVVYSVRFTDSGRVDVDATNGAIVRVEEPGQQDVTPSSNSGSSSNDDSDDSSSGSSQDDQENESEDEEDDNSGSDSDDSEED